MCSFGFVPLGVRRRKSNLLWGFKKKLQNTSIPFFDLHIKNGHPAEGIDSGDPAALSHVFIPSVHVSGMVAASYFARAAALLNPLTLSLRTLSASPLEIPDPERACTHLMVRGALLQCSPFCTCSTLNSFRTISYLHASRLPFKHTFTFTSAHTPESPQNCALPSRGAHLTSSSLHYTQTAVLPAPSAPPSHAPAPHVRRTGQVTSASRTDRRRPENPCVNHTLVSQGMTAVECTPHARASAGPPLSAARGRSGPIKNSV